MSGSLIAFFYLCSVSIRFSAPSLPEMKFQRNFPPSFCFFLDGFLNHLPNGRRTHLLCCRQTLSTHVQTSAPLTHSQLPARMHEIEHEASQRQFSYHKSPLIAQTKLQTSRNVIGEQNSRLASLVFANAEYFSRYSCGRRNKERRRKKMNKIKNFQVCSEQQREVLQFGNFSPLKNFRR